MRLIHDAFGLSLKIVKPWNTKNFDNLFTAKEKKKKKKREIIDNFTFDQINSINHRYFSSRISMKKDRQFSSVRYYTDID